MPKISKPVNLKLVIQDLLWEAGERNTIAKALALTAYRIQDLEVGHEIMNAVQRQIENVDALILASELLGLVQES